MMELQKLQEALKVEIQVHQKLVAQMKQDPQNADLKKQLHELQAKITALSEKQKKVVEQLRKELLVKQEPEVKLQQVQGPAEGKTLLLPPPCQQQTAGAPHHQASPQKTLTVTPVLHTKTLPLVLKAATNPLPASMATPRPTVAMVTAISNPPRATTNPDSHSAPVNLQVASKLTNQDADAPARVMSKNVIVVRPKPSTPNNVPIAPAPPPPMMAPPQLLHRPVTLPTKPPAAAAAGPVHQVRIVNGQPCGGKAGVAGGGAVGGGTAGHVAGLTVSNLNADTKTVKSQAGSEQVPTSTPLSPPLPVPKVKREENPQKLAFMVSLGLVTHDHLEEIQSRRQERKRRTTANPVYSGAVFEPERKKSAVTYLNTPLHQGTRKRGRPPKHSSTAAGPEPGCHPRLSPSDSHPVSPAAERPEPLPVHPHTLPQPSPSSGDGDIHEDFCTVCRRSGQLLMCDTCSRVYHLDCLDPPLKNIPKGMWICPKCQDQILKKEEAIPWPGTLAIVHSYIAYKEAKEEEKQKLMKWSAELKLEREHLEQRVKQLSTSITKCMENKNSILARQKDMQASLDKVKHLVRLIHSANLSQPTGEAASPDGSGEGDGPQDPKPSERERSLGQLGAGAAAEASTDATPQCEPAHAASTDVLQAAGAGETAVPKAEPTEVKANGNTDSRSPGRSQEEGQSAVQTTDAGNPNPTTSESRAEEAAETQARQPEAKDHGNSKTSELSQQFPNDVDIS